MGLGNIAAVAAHSGLVDIATVLANKTVATSLVKAKQADDEASWVQSKPIHLARMLLEAGIIDPFITALDTAHMANPSDQDAAQAATDIKIHPAVASLMNSASRWMDEALLV